MAGRRVALADMGSCSIRSVLRCGDAVKRGLTGPIQLSLLPRERLLPEAARPCDYHRYPRILTPIQIQF